MERSPRMPEIRSSQESEMTTLRKRFLNKWSVMSALLIGFSAYFLESHKKGGDEKVKEEENISEALKLDEETIGEFPKEELEEAARALEHITFRIQSQLGRKQAERDGEDGEGRMFGLRDLEWVYEPDPTSTTGDGVLSFRSGNRVTNISILEEDVPIAETLLRYGVEEFGHNFTIYDHNVDLPEHNISYTEFSLEVNSEDDDETKNERFLLKVRIDHVNDIYTIQNVSNFDDPVVLKKMDDSHFSEDLSLILEEKNELRKRVMALHEARLTPEELGKALGALKAELSATFEYDHFGEN